VPSHSSRRAPLVGGWEGWSAAKLLHLRLCAAQGNQPGRSIGKVSTTGELIVVELEDGVLGSANLFNLVGHTLRFTPQGARYRAESGALQWDSDFGGRGERSKRGGSTGR
jgi:hypothetical protein